MTAKPIVGANTELFNRHLDSMFCDVVSCMMEYGLTRCSMIEVLVMSAGRLAAEREATAERYRDANNFVLGQLVAGGMLPALN